MSNSTQITFDLPEVVIVTGSSSGLGEAVSVLLNNANVKVIGADIAEKTELLSSLENYVHFQGDITKVDVWQPLVNEIKSKGYKKIGLVTCAAILDVGKILEVTPEQIQRALNVNIIGVIQAIQSTLPLMIEESNGSIVVIGSISASFGEQELPIYASTKAAVKQLARTIALDYARQNIKVNVVSPGPMMAGLFKRHVAASTDPNGFHSKRANRQPYGKILEAEDVAKTVLFLLSNGSSAILGADIMADGGLTTGFDFYS